MRKTVFHLLLNKSLKVSKNSAGKLFNEKRMFFSDLSIIKFSAKKCDIGAHKDFDGQQLKRG